MRKRDVSSVKAFAEKFVIPPAAVAMAKVNWLLSENPGTAPPVLFASRETISIMNLFSEVAVISRTPETFRKSQLVS